VEFCARGMTPDVMERTRAELVRAPAWLPSPTARFTVNSLRFS
jgi:hypothetical protein